MPSVLIAGCGFVGQAAAELFQRGGWGVFAVTQSEESAQKLAEKPWRTVACDIADHQILRQKLAEHAGIDLVVDCVSAGGGGADQYQRVYFEGAKNLIEILAPRQIVFTSSTSVYAQTDGSMVTEESLAEPERETGKILRATERLVLAANGLVARLAGIYGPGRSATLRKFLDGRAVLEGDGQRHLNFIHRDDAARALFFLATENAPPGIYNVVDDAPVSQREFYRALAAIFPRPLPPPGPPELDRKRGWTDKRVSNSKLRALGWSPDFPSFQSAYAGGFVD